MAGSSRARDGDALRRSDPALRDQAWQRFRVKDGAKGPLVWEVKHTFIYPKDEVGLPAAPYHRLVARDVLDPTETKDFVSHAPAETSVGQLLRVAFSRRRIARCFEDPKAEIGLDPYEGCRYQGRKRRLFLSAVRYPFLARVHHDLRGEKSRPDGLPGAHRGGGGGSELAAFQARCGTPLRTNGGGNPLDPGTPGPGPPKPRENHPTKTARPGHSLIRPPTAPMELDFAL
jgi:hypothetical protein